MVRRDHQHSDGTVDELLVTGEQLPQLPLTLIMHHLPSEGKKKMGRFCYFVLVELLALVLLLVEFVLPEPTAISFKSVPTAAMICLV